MLVPEDKSFLASQLSHGSHGWRIASKADKATKVNTGVLLVWGEMTRRQNVAVALAKLASHRPHLPYGIHRIHARWLPNLQLGRAGRKYTFLRLNDRNYWNDRNYMLSVPTKNMICRCQGSAVCNVSHLISLCRVWQHEIPNFTSCLLNLRTWPPCI